MYQPIWTNTKQVICLRKNYMIHKLYLMKLMICLVLS